MPDVNQDFVATAGREGWYSDELIKKISEAGHIHFDQVPEKWQRVFVTAHDVTPEWHIRMQAAFQDYTDSAISKTCNFPESATEDDVRKIYELAYQLDCKGVTVYRDNSREQQVLSTGKTAQKVKQAAGAGEAADVVQTKAEVAELKATIAELEAELSRTKQQLHEVESENLQRRAKRSRPELLRGTTRRLETPLGTLYVTITEDDKAQPFEVFTRPGVRFRSIFMGAAERALRDARRFGRGQHRQSVAPQLCKERQGRHNFGNAPALARPIGTRKSGSSGTASLIRR